MALLLLYPPRTMRLFAALLLLPFAASAQIVLTSDQSTGATPQIYIGRNNCKTQIINFSWDLGLGNPVAGTEVDVLHVRSSGTCGSTSVTAPDTDNAAPSQLETGTDQVKAIDMILDQSDAGLQDGCDNTTRPSSNPWTTYYCVQLKPVGGFGFGGAPTFASIPVNFAMANPTAPTGLVINEGDQHLKVNWTVGDAAETIATYDVHVLLPDAGYDSTKYASRVSSATSADVTQTDDGAALQDDTTYVVKVVATDNYGNVSDPSDPANGTPRHILDFYDLYRDEGGSATGGGGCSSAGSATWIALGVLLVGLLARRKKGAALVAGLALLAPAARAERRDSDRASRRLLVGFKVDRYDPKVDSEAGLTGQPYHRIFGSRAPLRYQLEVDWEVAHPFGSLLLGVTAGYWQNFGKGLTADTRQVSGDTALLDVMPFGVVATYRFDWLADRWVRFPFIPYAQIGFQRALWASFSGTGAVSKDVVQGGRGSGWTSGYSTALGMAFSLDAIDPDLAREAYIDAGIQRTSLFAEYGWTRLDGFGKGGVLILTDRAWRFGIAMEF